MTRSTIWMSGRRWLPSLALYALYTVAIGAWLFGPGQSRGPRVPADLQSMAEAYAIGARGAPLGLILYCDFRCPYCAVLALDTVPMLLERYVNRGTLRMAFRHFPLTEGHPDSAEVAGFADCAVRSGIDFWQLQDVLFRHPTQLDQFRRIRLLRKTGLSQNAMAMEGCAVSPSQETVQADRRHGRSLGVRSTPTLLLGIQNAGAVRVTRVFEGLEDQEVLLHAIEALHRQGPGRRVAPGSELNGTNADGRVAGGTR